VCLAGERRASEKDFVGKLREEFYKCGTRQETKNQKTIEVFHVVFA
jgi:hypothetical protein